MRSLRASVGGLLLATAAVSTACGSHTADGGGQDGHTSVWRTSRAAATGFADYLAGASGKKCGDLAPLLGADYFVGSMAPDVIAGYSCKHVMTPTEVAGRCARDVVRPVITDPTPSTLSQDPPRLRYSVSWTGTTVCVPGAGMTNDVLHEKGSYDVTVEQGSGGWTAVGFEIVSGPGAGSSGGRT